MAFANLMAQVNQILAGSGQPAAPAPAPVAAPVAQAAPQSAVMPPKAEMFAGGALGPLPAGIDPSKFKMNPDGTVGYVSGPNQTKIPLAYFQSGAYQSDMNRYGQVIGPGGIFQENAPTWDGGQFHAPNPEQVDPALYQQNDQGQVIDWSPVEGSRLKTIDSAYQSMLRGDNSTTDFSQFGRHPDTLGADVMMGLANGGMWMPTGANVSDRNRNIEARLDQQGNILVTDPRGGDGANPIYIYGPDGKFLRQEVGSKTQSPVSGVASVILAGMGMSALGSAAAGAGAAGAGAGEAAGGVAGLSSGADLSAFYGGLDGGATLGGGASVAGGSSLGALGGAGAGAGITGFGTGADADAFFGGLDNGATLGGGASVNGGAALGTLPAAGAGGGGTPPPPNPNALPEGVPPPANPFDPSNLGNVPTSGGLGSSVLDALIKTGVSAGASALLGGGGSAGADPSSGLTAEETARQKKLQDAVDAINTQFGYGTTDAAKANKASRDSMYSDISGAVRDTAMRDLDKQFSTASNRNTFGLARTGLLGGSVDAESGGDLQTRYGEGTLKATQQGQQSASDLRSSDEQSRQNLISLAQSGLDTGTASSLAAGQMSASADSVKGDATSATVGRLFDDMTQAYAQNRVLNARYPTGLPASAGYSSGLFSPSKYTGRIQG